MKQKCYSNDLFRYYGSYGESFLQKLFRPYELKYLRCFRKAKVAKSPFARLLYKWKLKKLSYKTQIQIPLAVEIGDGLYIGHIGRIIISPKATLGKNINLATGVTIGQENRGARKGAPTICDNVWIGTNAVIVGNVTIGNDVLIAPLSFVNFDVPPHSIVLGNPGKIISRENATENYIKNTI